MLMTVVCNGLLAEVGNVRSAAVNAGKAVRQVRALRGSWGDLLDGAGLAPTANAKSGPNGVLENV
jgi:hypothetical protein